MAKVETIARGVACILGDCREVLPNLATIVPDLRVVSHIICDPPYEDELHNSKARLERTDGRKMKLEVFSDCGFEGVNANRLEYAQLITRASNGWAIVFSLAEGVRAWRDDLQAAGAKWDTTLAWIKPDASPRFNGQGAARGFECAITAWCGKGYRKWNGGGKRGIYTHCVNTGRQGEHPTEKPLPLMAELVADYTQPGETICDPFMGSGTTGVACVQTGRKFIGIEKDEKWFDLSRRRISEALKQGDMFVAKPAPAKQLGWDAMWKEPFKAGSN